MELTIKGGEEGLRGHLVMLIKVSLQLAECYFGDIVLSVPAASGIIRNQSFQSLHAFHRLLPHYFM